MGDKILASSTDSLLSQFGSDFEQTSNSTSELNETAVNKKSTSINKRNEQTENINEKDTSSKSSPCAWKFYQDKKNDEFYKAGYRIQMTLQKVVLKIIKKRFVIKKYFFISNLKKAVKNIAWHPKGDYFASVLDDKNSNSSVIMHQLSKQKSVRPFAKMNGIVQQVVFHPFKPILFVAVSYL